MSTLDTSAESRRSISNPSLSEVQRTIFNIVLGCQRNGRPDLSLTEIQDIYERAHSRRIEKSVVSSRVSELVSAGRLVRATGIRKCTKTSRNVEPVSVPPQQARFFA